MSAYNIDAFCIQENEKFIYAADKSGQILTIDTETFTCVNKKQVHYGSISAIAIHPKYKYLACNGNDGYISILKYDENGSISIVHMVQSRNIKPENDPYLRNHTTTQAINFHDTEKKVVGHGGSSALFELRFDETHYELLHCSRIHETDDFLTARYVPGTDKILSGSVGGVAILSEGNKKLKEWKFFATGTPSIHWFEQIENDVYMLACDGRKVIRLDINNDKNTLEGPFVVKDHMEHVTYCKKNMRLYATSFDRTVTEIDPVTCDKVKVVWHAPFKLRWIKVLETAPAVMIVQCRNGGLYKVNVETKQIIACIKLTNDTLWSLDALNDTLISSGEGDTVLKIKLANSFSSFERLPLFTIEKAKLLTDKYYYTKRVATHAEKKITAHGRTNGDVVIELASGVQKNVNVASAVRDLCFDGEGNNLFVGNEDGIVHSIAIHTENIREIHRSIMPCWAISYNQERNLLAIADRVNNIYLLNLDTLEKEKIVADLGFIKRIKWQDSDNLLYGSAGTLFRYNLPQKTFQALCSLENTVEDFAWDSLNRYIVIVDYTRYLYLCDFATGEMLYEHGDMIDYSKGILFLDKLQHYQGYPGDFLVVGRAGMPLLHRIHDDRIISYGSIHQLTNKEVRHESQCTS